MKNENNFHKINHKKKNVSSIAFLRAARFS